jgi:hypothetical protein
MRVSEIFAGIATEPANRRMVILVLRALSAPILAHLYLAPG